MSGLNQNLAPALTANSSNTASSNNDTNSALQDLEESLDTTLFRTLTRQEVYRHLKWAGFRHNYHTLSTLRLFQRTIVLVDDHGLHLLWKSSIHTEYIKPLPEVFGSPNFDVNKLGHLSRGLLYSYTRLIETEVDYEIARELKLPPAAFRDETSGWTKWKEFADAFQGSSHYRKRQNNGRHAPACMGDSDYKHATLCPAFKSRAEAKKAEFERTQDELLEKCHDRYQYGDLRLSRVDWIVRFNVGMKGWKWNFYRTRSPKDSFVTQHRTLIAAYVFYVAVILTAMQLSLQAFPYVKWTVSTFGYFGYIVIVFTSVQVPVIGIFFFIWLVMQLTTFWWISRGEERKNASVAASKGTP
jgi:hypothetical protein